MPLVEGRLQPFKRPQREWEGHCRWLLDRQPNQRAPHVLRMGAWASSAPGIMEAANWAELADVAERQATRTFTDLLCVISCINLRQYGSTPSCFMRTRVGVFDKCVNIWGWFMALLMD